MAVSGFVGGDFQNGSTNDGRLLLQFTVGSMQLLNYICTFIIKSILILFENKKLVRLEKRLEKKIRLEKNKNDFEKPFKTSVVPSF